MLLAAGMSYQLGNPPVALASATALLISETVDWIVYGTAHPVPASGMALGAGLCTDG